MEMISLSSVVGQELLPLDTIHFTYMICARFIRNTVRIIRGASVMYNHAFALFGAFPCLCAEVRGSFMRDPCVYAVVGLCDRALRSTQTMCKGPVTQAQTQGLRMDRVQFPTFARVLRNCRF